MKIRPKKVGVFHEDGQTDMTLIATFHNFMNAPGGLHCNEIDARILISPCSYHGSTPATPVGSRMSGLHEYDKRGDSQWQPIIVR